MRFNISFHDVMPESFTQMESILELTNTLGAPPVTLLIIPARNWLPEQLQRLRELSEFGHELAAHGWTHKAKRKKGLYHQLYSAFVSGDVAEHLDLHSEQICALMQRSYDWFIQNQLPAPSLYVPPAWALGQVSLEDLERLPYKRIEVLRGFIEIQSGRLRRAPLVGFEARFMLQALALQSWNRVQLLLGRVSQISVRVAIHPNDCDLRLAGSLRDVLERYCRWHQDSCPEKISP